VAVEKNEGSNFGEFSRNRRTEFFNTHSPLIECANAGVQSKIRPMTAREKRIRAAVTVGYFAVCFVVLFYYTKGSSFCERPGESGHFSQTLHLTTACTLWEVLVSICGALAARKLALDGLAPFVSTALALAGLASIPFWIYDSGTFLLEGTWADVSCFFTEGYGMMFPFIVAPGLAVATLAGELIILRANKLPSVNPLSLGS
jgi:hypothetical protein